MKAERVVFCLACCLWLQFLRGLNGQTTQTGAELPDGSCSPGSYRSEAGCVACPQQCSKCSASFFCDECKSNYFLSNRKCQTCGYNCEACESFFKCIRCSSGFGLTGQFLCEQSINAKPGLSNAGLAGVILGSVLGFAIIICVIYCIVKKRRQVALAPDGKANLPADSNLMPTSNTRRTLDSERGSSSRSKKHRTQNPSAASQLDLQQTQPQKKRSGTSNFGTLPPISKKSRTLRY